jgi:hypothetical protein
MPKHDRRVAPAPASDPKNTPRSDPRQLLLPIIATQEGQNPRPRARNASETGQKSPKRQDPGPKVTRFRPSRRNE